MAIQYLPLSQPGEELIKLVVNTVKEEYVVALMEHLTREGFSVTK